MISFLPKEIWENKRGFPFKKLVGYLPAGYHTGQDFLTESIGKVPVIAPCDGLLMTFPFSKSAGWWGFYKFNYEGKIYSLKILHMHKKMRDGKYKESDILGYCGATGLSITQRYGKSYIGESNEEQISDRAVPHLHAELHIGEYKDDTNRIKLLADKRIIDPISNFEKWLSEKSLSKNIVFYKECGKSSVYIKGADNVFYPIIMGRHFITLFGNWSDNTIKEIDEIKPKSDNYFGLFKSNEEGEYETA